MSFNFIFLDNVIVYVHSNRFLLCSFTLVSFMFTQTVFCYVHLRWFILCSLKLFSAMFICVGFFYVLVHRFQTVLFCVYLPTISLEMPVPSQGHYVFTVFRLLTDFVCLYT
jgi:hypothetical protein